MMNFILKYNSYKFECNYRDSNKLKKLFYSNLTPLKLRNLIFLTQEAKYKRTINTSFSFKSF